MLKPNVLSMVSAPQLSAPAGRTTRIEPKGANVIELRDLDPDLGFLAQLQNIDDGHPVVLVNTFVAPDGRVQEVTEVWRLDSAIMRRQPGFISAQLYRGPGTSGVLTNVAVWESAAVLWGAFTDAEFQQTLALYPDGTVAYPVLVRPRAVPGVCVA
jgi:quinol monooxygenase YgiN